ncbi:CoA transferase subunit A [Clostridium amazonitimonense]|uniref:CoA transferase subunit A n=1 Tax=Clostridium amazonitimonense TaxID=1499689 RepID=UPI0005094B46|nr:CoA transferase subunit A [Clostridium amazonitimonense]
MDKVVKLQEIKPLFKDGMTIMMGGFLGCGSAHTIINYLVDLNIKDLTIITNDTCYPNEGVGKLLSNGQIKKLIASYIGGNADTGRLMNEGKLQAELIPQGTLAEKIRAGGSGLGAVITPTGVGTIVEEGKEKLIINNKEYLVELPLKADLSILKGTIVDEFGNIFYRGTTKNFNPVMAMAGDVVIVEAEEIVKLGDLDPDNIHTPGVLVDYVIKELE